MLSIRGIIAFYAFCLPASSLLAQDSRLFSWPDAPTYEKALASQPKGLTLTVSLLKDHFYQGEIINATLTYSNSSNENYQATLAKWDRSGRVQEIHFLGADDHQTAVEDPIGWIYYMPFPGGGQVEVKSLGTGSVTLVMNQWLRFDHPGTYTVFAVSTAVCPEKQALPNADNSIQLVSKKITVTITPLPAEQEKGIIDDATQKIDAGYHRDDSPQLTDAQNDENAVRKAYAAEPAIAILRYLQTPAARAALRTRLDKMPDMAAGLLGAPDRPAEAALILADVQAGRLKIDSSLIGLYTQLKTYPQFMAEMANERRQITPAEIPQRQAIGAAWEKGRKDAEKEILAAAIQAGPKSGLSNLDLIWMAFQYNPSDTEYRGPMVAHQLDFPHEKQLRLLSMAATDVCRHHLPQEKDTSADFMPLVRLYLGAPAYNRNALMILSYANPQEAHDLTLADWASPEHHYFNYEHQDTDAPMGELAVTLLENPKIKWTDEQKQILDRMRRPH